MVGTEEKDVAMWSSDATYLGVSVRRPGKRSEVPSVLGVSKLPAGGRSEEEGANLWQILTGVVHYIILLSTLLKTLKEVTNVLCVIFLHVGLIACQHVRVVARAREWERAREGGLKGSVQSAQDCTHTIEGATKYRARINGSAPVWDVGSVMSS